MTRAEIEALWAQATRDRDLRCPTERAAIDRVLTRAVRGVSDQSLRGHVAALLRQRRDEAFGYARPPDLADRVAALKSRVARIERARRVPSAPSHFAPDTGDSHA